MRSFAVFCAVLAFCADYVRSQTTTTTIDNLGQTVVEVITLDPQGIPVTQTISTLASTTTTPDVGQQGPVGQPPEAPQGPAGGPTPFTYTTTDAAGNIIVTEGTFTPSFSTGSPTTPPSGTILDYSSWRASLGTNTVPVFNSGVRRWSMDTRWLSIGAALCAGLTGGGFLVFA